METEKGEEGEAEKVEGRLHFVCFLVISLMVWAVRLLSWETVFWLGTVARGKEMSCSISAILLRTVITVGSS